MRRVLLPLIGLCLLFAGPPAHAQDAKPRTVEDVAAELRDATRKQEKDAGGFEWQPWTKARASFGKYGADRDPAFAAALGDGQHVDFAIADVDRNGAPDLLVYFWGACGNRGCPVNVYFDRAEKDVMYFSGWTIRPAEMGVSVDGSNFAL